MYVCVCVYLYVCDNGLIVDPLIDMYIYMLQEYGAIARLYIG